MAAAHTPGATQCAAVNRQCAPVVLPVQPNKTYRLRVASTTSLASLNLAIGVRETSKLLISFSRIHRRLFINIV